MTIECIITYDVNTETREGEKRLRRVARACEGLGVRVQKSVFEFRCSEAQLITLLHRIRNIIEPVDSVRVYRVPRGGLDNTETMGRPDRIRTPGSVIW